MPSSSQRAKFERVVLPHLDAAYNLARWLVHNDHDAEDVVQEACVRAYRFIDGFRGGNPRAWLLTIVRNVFRTRIGHGDGPPTTEEFDEQLHSVGCGEPMVDNGMTVDTPETLLLQKFERQVMQRCLEALPVEFREVVILRELEGCSYKEISEIVAIPLGTVMSRLSRGRSVLQRMLLGPGEVEP